MEPPSCGARFKPPRLIVTAEVVVERIAKRMQHPPSGRCILPSREKVALVAVAARAAVNQVIVAVVALGRDGSVMIDRQLAPRVGLGDAAVATAVLVTLSDLVEHWVSHTSQPSRPSSRRGCWCSED